MYNMIRCIADLTEKQRNAVFSDSMITDFDESLSFAIIKGEDVLGYVLLKAYSIDESLKIEHRPSFPISQFACEILRIRPLVGENDTAITLSLLKTTLNRVEMWYNKDNEYFKYLWGVFSQEGDAHFFADTMNCDISKCLLGTDTMKFIIFRELDNDMCG